MSGQQLKRLRQIHNYTQKELAQKLGVSRQALCMWESNKREIKITFLKKIARTFDVSVDDIISTNKYLFFKKGDKMKAKSASKATKSSKAKAAKSTTPAAKTKSTSKSTTNTLKKQKKVQIKLSAPDAKNVLLLGDFNSWDMSGIQMEKSKRGVWKTDMTLQPGRYEYKFIVDNEWWTDPSNNNVVWNNVGSQNSFFELN